MKKKIIISLFLAMCCIVASIPASAGEDAAKGVVCVDHGPFLVRCYNNVEGTPTTHRFYIGTAEKQCSYTRYNASTEVYCKYCNATTDTSAAHGHGASGHVNPDDCGGANVTGCYLSEHSYS